MEAFLAELCDRFPAEAGELSEAASVFQRHRLLSLERIARLTEAQWGRIALPMGVESLIREELVTAGAPEEVLFDATNADESGVALEGQENNGDDHDADEDDMVEVAEGDGDAAAVKDGGVDVEDAGVFGDSLTAEGAGNEEDKDDEHGCGGAEVPALPAARPKPASRGRLGTRVQSTQRTPERSRSRGFTEGAPLRDYLISLSVKVDDSIEYTFVEQAHACEAAYLGTLVLIRDLSPGLVPYKTADGTREKLVVHVVGDANEVYRFAVPSELTRLVGCVRKLVEAKKTTVLFEKFELRHYKRQNGESGIEFQLFAHSKVTGIPQAAVRFDSLVVEYIALHDVPRAASKTLSIRGEIRNINLVGKGPQNRCDFVGEDDYLIVVMCWGPLPALWKEKARVCIHGGTRNDKFQNVNVGESTPIVKFETEHTFTPRPKRVAW